MMTRKDYVKFARAISDALLDASDDPAALPGMHHLAHGIVDILAEDNPRFDRDRFYAAAGLKRFDSSLHDWNRGAPTIEDAQ